MVAEDILEVLVGLVQATLAPSIITAAAGAAPLVILEMAVKVVMAALTIVDLMAQVVVAGVVLVEEELVSPMEGKVGV